MSWHNIAKRIAYYILPPGIECLIRDRLLSSLLTSEEQQLLLQNRVLYNRHIGERCFILATGPSINKQDLKLLQGETCIAVSNFFVHPDYQVIKPKYYCIAPYHPPITEDAWRDWMSELNKGIGKVHVFISIDDRIRNETIFTNPTLHYIKFTGMRDCYSVKPMDITKAIPYPQSVSIFALFMALYMGFNKIYLLGCDHDWILHLNESSHFYAENQHRLVQLGYNEWFGNDFGSYCRDYMNLWRQYKMMKIIAFSQGSEIQNATEGGLLDIFPRVELRSVFDSSK